MYRLLLVDDEEIVLRGIQKVFPLAEYNLEITGTFTNPKKALEELPMLAPHLIITDIKMPAMNGLTFASKAKQLLPDVEIVILSGYDDFAFAQTAVKIGVSDYLLKPIKKHDFIKMLTEMQKRISAKLNVTKQLSALQSVTMSNYATLRNKFFFTVIEQGNAADNSIETLSEQLGLCVRGFPFVLIKFVINEIKARHDYMSTIEKLMNEFPVHMRSYGYFEEFYTDEYIYFYLYDIDRQRTERNNILEHVKLFTDMKKQDGITMFYGISHIHEDLSNLFMAVSECDEHILALDNTVAETQLNHVTLPMRINELHLPHREIENFFVGITTNDKNMIGINIDAIFDQTTNMLYRDYGYSIAYILFLRLVHMQRKYRATQPIITPELLSSSHLHQRYTTLPQLKEIVKTKAEQMASLIFSQSQEAPSKIILKAIAYIEHHFHENISLTEVSEHTFISKNYLCDLLKKHLNLTFIDYVTALRIEKAKYYLSQTNMKMYEISQAVGYNDYSYFSQIFKRHTGTTLSSYRREH